jgi:ferrochelatase
VAKLLQERLPEQFVVKLAMRYQSPSMQSMLDEMKQMELEEIVVVPMFPQYASATTGSVHQKVMEIVKEWQLIPKITLVDEYAANSKIIKAFAHNARQEMEKVDFDHIIFSYHGLPVRQLKKADSQCKADSECCKQFTSRNRLCYRAQCYETSRKLVEELGLEEGQYTVCFQSRLGKTPWIEPYTEDTIKHLAANGVKNILAFSPSFVADCLETTVEVGEEYYELFEEMGGEKLVLVESLNSNPLWVEALEDIVKQAMYKPEPLSV